MRLALAAALALFATAAQAQTPLTGTTGPIGSSAPAKSGGAPAQPGGAVARSSGGPAATGPGAEQTAPTATTHARRRMTLQERFDAANTTHDGHLTQEQARAHMPSVARDFAAIDTDHKGYVTLDQIRAHTRSQRAARRAARAAAKTQ